MSSRIQVSVTAYHRLRLWFSRGSVALRYENVAKDDTQRGHARWLQWSAASIPALGTGIPKDALDTADRWKYRLVAVVRSESELQVESIPPK